MTTIRTRRWRTCSSNRGGTTARQSANSRRPSNPAQRLCYIRETVGESGAAVATDALWAAGHTVICCDATRLAACGDVSTVVSVLGREALLRSASLVVSPIEAFGPHAVDVIFRLARSPVPVVLTGTSAWDPNWSDRVPLITEASRLTVGERTELWRRELGPLAHGIDVGDIAAQYVFGPRQIAAAITAAEALARSTRGTPIDSDLRRGARSQNAAGLERLARRVEPAVSWRDIVLPERPCGSCAS